MITEEQVAALVSEILRSSDHFLVEVQIAAGNRITVFFDGDGSVSIDDCKKLNRSLEEKLDREKEDFELTVSSSGMDRPIKLLRQYRKRIGKELEISTVEGEKVNGILAGVTDTSIELEHPVKKPGKELQKPNTIIQYNSIKKAKLVITIGK